MDFETIIYEKDGGEVCCIIRSEIRRDAAALASRWEGQGGRTHAVCFLKGKTVGEAENEILAHIRSEIAKPRA